MLTCHTLFYISSCIIIFLLAVYSTNCITPYHWIQWMKWSLCVWAYVCACVSIYKYEHDVLIHACRFRGLMLMCVFLFHSPLYFLRQGTLLNLAVLCRHINESHPSTGITDLRCHTQILYMIGIQTQVLMCAVVRASPTEPSVQPQLGCFLATKYSTS